MIEVIHNYEKISFEEVIEAIYSTRNSRIQRKSFPSLNINRFFISFLNLWNYFSDFFLF